MGRIKQITTYMMRGNRVIRVSTVRVPGELPEEPYETMVFEGRSGFKPLQDKGGDYCQRGSFATSLHEGGVNRYWGKGFRTSVTEAVVE